MCLFFKKPFEKIRCSRVVGRSQAADAEGAPAGSGAVRAAFSVCFCHPYTQQTSNCEHADCPRKGLAPGEETRKAEGTEKTRVNEALAALDGRRSAVKSGHL